MARGFRGPTVLAFERREAALQFQQLPPQLGQASDQHRRLAPGPIVDGRQARHEEARCQRVGDPGLPGRLHAVAHRDVPGHPDLAAEHHVVANGRAAGNPHLCGQQRARTHHHAVRDLYQVVDLRARLDARFADRWTIDGRVGADLDIVFEHDRGGLRNLLVGAVGPAGEPITVGADDHAVLQHHAGAEAAAFAHRDVRVNHAVGADLGAGADDGVCVNYRARADDRAGPDDGQRADADALADARHRAAMIAVGCTPTGSVEGGASAAAARAKARYGSRARSTAQGAVGPWVPRMIAEARGCRPAVGVGGAREEGHVARAGRLQSGHPMDLQAPRRLRDWRRCARPARGASRGSAYHAVGTASRSTNVARCWSPRRSASSCMDAAPGRTPAVARPPAGRSGRRSARPARRRAPIPATAPRQASRWPTVVKVK